MKSDALAMNLIEYTNAMDRYKNGNERRAFRGTFSVQEEYSCLQALMRIDEKLGYTSAADKLETVLEFGSKRLSADLRKKVERMQLALRDSETEPTEPKVRLAVWVSGQGQYHELWAFAMGLVGSTGGCSHNVGCQWLRQKPDEMADALAAFFVAFDLYKDSHPREFKDQIDSKEEASFNVGVQNLDRELGYV